MTAKVQNLAYGLETPYPLQPCQNYFRLEGWALIPDSTAPTQVRIRIGDDVHLPKQVHARADVAAQFPDDPFAADSGFEFVCYLGFGNYLGALEASADGGSNWRTVLSMMIPVSSHPLMGEFEPMGRNGRVTDPIRPAGWVWHPEFHIQKLELLFGNMSLAVDFGIDRPDVAARFPEQPGAAQSGFMLAENLPRGEGLLRLKVTTDCGRTYFLDSGMMGKIKNGAFAPERKPDEWWVPPPRLKSEPKPQNESDGTLRRPGPVNVLFVLYGDFTSNSAHHVTAIANEMMGRGYDCLVAVPRDAETIGAQPEARFLAVEYDEVSDIADYFGDNQGPAVTYVWTPREPVRQFCEEVFRRFDTDLVVHLEDNEEELLRNHLALSPEAWEALADQDFDTMMPAHLSHPIRAVAFMEQAKGVTTIVDRLGEFVPSGIPQLTFWPAATSAFRPLPPEPKLRASLGIPPEDTVVFYHGNAHAANRPEMTELYRAIAELNAAHHPTWLLRAGRDDDTFAREVAPILGERLIAIGFVKRAKDLPVLMSMADCFVQPGAPGAFNDYRFPSKLPEFFAIGRPVIVPKTNLGNALVDGRDALVLERADATPIARAIMTVQSDPKLRDTLSRGAVAFAEKNFSWSDSTDRILDFLRAHSRLERPSPARITAARAVRAAYDQDATTIDAGAR